MGLICWLPLTGTVENKGVSNITVTNNGATVDTNGKIGSCYSFNGNNYYISLVGQQLFDCFKGENQQFSMCMWVYHADSRRAILFGDWSLSNSIGFNIELSTGHGVRFYWNGSPDYSPGINVGASTWNHIAFTYDGTALRSYLNGSLIATRSGALAARSKTTGEFRLGRDNRTTDTALNGKLNDVRIYKDHCLSAAEVHEISQGLVLHYKLDDTYMETPTFLTSTINTTAYNSSNGKYGYNDTSNLARTEGMFQGKQCIKISTITAGQNAQPYSYFSNLYTSNGTNSPAYKALSFDYYTTCPTTTWLNIYKLGSGTGTATWKTTSATMGTRTGTYTNSSNSILVQPNEWNRVEIIFHGTTDADAQWGYCINGPTHTSNADYYFLFANIQLEQNDHVTGQGAGLHKAIITDSSGYGHNGTITGNLNLSSDTPRYSTDIQFPGTAYIKITSPSTEIRTISLWAKWNSIPSGQSIIYVDQKSKTGLGLASNGIIVNANQTGNTFNKSSLVANTWYHFVIVSPNGSSNATRKFYINGVEQTATSNTNSWSYTIDELQLGKRSTSSDGFNGKISDFRMYCTALSADDVLSLYHTTAKVDNLGGLHTFEAIENISNIIFKIDSARGAKVFQDGLSRYTQANCQVTLTDDGYRIYRPPNLTTSTNGNTMWGGLKLVNQASDTISAYTTPRDNHWNLQQNHTYLCAFHVKGQSTNTTSFGWSNNMGWGGGGVSPSPTILINDGIPANFQGEKDCIFIFTIGDTISKACTSAYSSYAAGTTYLSYRHLTFGWGYSSTGELGTDVYLTNLRLYDITNFIGQIKKNGQANFSDFVENNSIARILKNAEFLTNNLIEK